ncbi:hypothetical protein BKK79_03910 [Cupriavidus sp. USMAA2-4]|uniref:MgtC-like C-terminal domain-containing protein n=1 Tax=Cupriavidus malaysiensis TaxID=367825 RepID=A0ABM6F3M7_9BURK|nr:MULTISPECIES: hypothetical protein [Cupriavidus]AOY91054.1 hypothetical protein BKK79_03910 [Cupriavidus sp. USMAA2-4]AOY99371.1 hypothetical protein BKK81_08920 [Cupriavidus sp. USMAHM13]AOZ05988.1 hypothetical protein BKK80_09205 [Cupriavidus malaysiensis]
MRFLHKLMPATPAATAAAAAGACPPPAMPASQLFQVVVLCRDAGERRIAQQILDELDANQMTLRSLHARSLAQRELTEVRVLLQCPQDARAAMVRLVQVLGFTPLVRSVRWETVPQPARALAATTH